MKSLTYTVECHADEPEYMAPDFASFSVTEADYHRWLRISDRAQEDNLFRSEAFDARCVFLDEDQLPLENFPQDLSRVVITRDGISFTGYETHGEYRFRWFTNEVALTTIADDLDLH